MHNALLSFLKIMTLRLLKIKITTTYGYTYHTLGHLFDGVDTQNCDSVTGDDSFTKRPVAVKLQVAGHLSLRKVFRHLLELQHLVVNAVALVRHNEEWIQRTFGPTSLLTEWMNS